MKVCGFALMASNFDCYRNIREYTHKKKKHLFDFLPFD